MKIMMNPPNKETQGVKVMAASRQPDCGPKTVKMIYMNN